MSACFSGRRGIGGFVDSRAKTLMRQRVGSLQSSGLLWTPVKGDSTKGNFALVGRRQVLDDRRDVLLVDRRAVDLDHLGDLGLPEVLLELGAGRLGLDVVGRMAGAAIALHDVEMGAGLELRG